MVAPEERQIKRDLEIERQTDREKEQEIHTYTYRNREVTYKEIKKDEFVIEYGSFGEEFYLIIEGEVEVLVPDISSEDFKKVDFELT